MKHVQITRFANAKDQARTNRKIEISYAGAAQANARFDAIYVSRSPDAGESTGVTVGDPADMDGLD